MSGVPPILVGASPPDRSASRPAQHRLSIARSCGAIPLFARSDNPRPAKPAQCGDIRPPSRGIVASKVSTGNRALGHYLLEMSRLPGGAKKKVLSKPCELRRTVVRIARLRLSRMTYEVTEWTVPRIGTIGGEPGRSAVSSWRPSRQATICWR